MLPSYEKILNNTLSRDFRFLMLYNIISASFLFLYFFAKEPFLIQVFFALLVVSLFAAVFSYFHALNAVFSSKQ